MKTNLSNSLLALFVTLTISTPALCEEEKDQKAYILERSESGPLVQKETKIIETQATVESIRRSQRKVTLKDADGQSVTVIAGPEVKRLEEIKVGDKIIVRYARSLALEVSSPTPEELKNPVLADSSSDRSAATEVPGGMAESTVHMIVTISKIDLKANTVTLALPDGDSMTTEARFPENLKRVKVGDKVAITYQQAIAIALEPAS